MSLRDCRITADRLCRQNPEMVKRFKEFLCELYTEGFQNETVGDVYEAFVHAWIEHTRPKMPDRLTDEERIDRQLFMDEAAGM